MKKITSIFICCFSILLVSACSAQNSKNGDVEYPTKDLTAKQLKDLNTAYFAAGCFWCVESIYQNIIGVEQAVSGFSGGKAPNPSYREVALGRTNYAETVRVRFDPDKVSYRQLVKIFYASHNPTVMNKVGPDVGQQYRSAIFYVNEKQRKIATVIKNKIDASDRFDEPIVTEIVSFQSFYPAKKRHQNYTLKNPNSPYVEQVSEPREKETLSQFLKLTAKEYLKLAQ